MLYMISLPRRTILKPKEGLLSIKKNKDIRTVDDMANNNTVQAILQTSSGVNFVSVGMVKNK